MLVAALFAFAHHLAAFTLFATLVLEFVLLRGELSVASARKILRTDMIFGIAATAILVIGAMRVIWFEKGAVYYMHSAPFIAKMILFAIIGLLSIYPTVTFLSWRKTLAQGQVPMVETQRMRTVKMVIHAELALLALLILCAALMAKGIGLISIGTNT
jgi:putative membrane protein